MNGQDSSTAAQGSKAGAAQASKVIRIEGDYDPETWFSEVRIDGEPLSPKASQRVRNHSPDGFAWGYGGSGPAQLALAILLAAGLNAEQATRVYQDFKFEFIAKLPRDKFVLELDVVAWALARR